MEDTLQRVFAILIGVVIFFLLPLYIAFEKKDDISYSLALKITSNFVNNVKTKGYISKDMYNKLISDLAVTGNDYNIQFEHIAKKYNPTIYAYDSDYKKVLKKFDYNQYKDQFEKNKSITVGPDEYIYLMLTFDVVEEHITTPQILNTLENIKPIVGLKPIPANDEKLSDAINSYTGMEETNIPYISALYRLRIPKENGTIDLADEGVPIYTMNKGDEFTVVIYNTNTTIASVLFNTLTFGANSGNDIKVYINYGATIQNESYRQTVLE